MFLRQYKDPMQIVLLAAGVISIYPVKQPGTGIMIMALTLLNAVLGLSQEGKAAAAVAALAKMMIIKARVRRDGKLALLPAEQFVPGDVVEIEAGDVVPADGRLLTAATLEVAESALTGESMPVGKGIECVAEPDAALGDRTDMVYMNTNVTRGTGTFVVTATAMATEVGHISGMLQHQDDSKSPLTVQLEKLTKQLVAIAGAALVASVVLNMARGQSFTDVFTVAVAFAIAAIPTGLPAVVTTILSRGTRLLADANAIVKRLRSTETLGATSAICSDKTGTLTLNQMTAVELTIPGRHYRVSGSGYSTEGAIKHVGGEPEVPLEPFMFPLALACDAVLTDTGEMIGDPTEGALVVLAEKGGLDLRAHPQALPARGRAAVRHGVQADGDVPPDDRRVGARDHPRLHQGRARPAARARRFAPGPGTRQRAGRRRLQGALSGGERAAGQAGPAGDGHGAPGLRSGGLQARRGSARADGRA